MSALYGLHLALTVKTIQKMRSDEEAELFFVNKASLPQKKNVKLLISR